MWMIEITNRQLAYLHQEMKRELRNHINRKAIVRRVQKLTRDQVQVIIERKVQVEAHIIVLRARVLRTGRIANLQAGAKAQVVIRDPARRHQDQAAQNLRLPAAEVLHRAAGERNDSLNTNSE